jgi:prolyl oligopeptidase
MTSYPPAERLPIVDRLHGRDVADPYRWLEDAGDPRTREWLAGQDRLWRRHAAGLPGRERIRRHIADLAATGLVTAPLWRGDRSFVLRREAGQQHAVLYARDGDGPERPLVDPAGLDPSGRTTLDSWQPDQTGRLLAYQISRDGTERAELYVLDVASGQVVDGPIGDCRYSPVAWLADGSAFYYVRRDRVLLHRVGAAQDVPVFGQGRPANTTYGLGISADGRWLAISATPGTAPRNDLWLADLAGSDPSAPELRVVKEGTPDRAAFVVGPDGRMYILTDRDAPNVRLCVADPRTPDRWRDLIPEDPEAVLNDFAVLDAAGVLVVSWLRGGIAEVSVHDLATGARVGKVPLPGAGSIGPLAARPQRATQVWFTYTDTLTPGAVWHYDHPTGETECWAAAPGAVRPPDVRIREIQCTSADGTPVRVTVLAREGAGPRAAILYGYGGFGVPLTPAFAADALSWVEAGGVLAIAHLRGGGEHGMRSHRAGMGEHKQRVFDDFIAAAEQLIADGVTAADRLAIWGESNGGLLVGAALTQRPDLFAAAVCCAPLLDMIRYERWGLGPNWRAEYGSAADPVEFGWLLGYSPYHRVRADEHYPATLFTVFGGDTRVDPAHARKMCAALQWANGGDRPILLRREDNVGHAARSAESSIELAADMLAFAAAHTGLAL